MDKSRYVIDKDDVVTRTPEWKQEKKKRWLQLKFKEFGIPSDPNRHIIGSSLDQYIGEDKLGNLDKIRKYLSYFKTKFYNKNLYFEGEENTQKTTLLLFIAKILVMKKVKVGYVTLPSLMELLVKNTSFSPDPDIINKLKFYRNREVLIIDDWNPQDMTARQKWASTHLKTFMETRFFSGTQSTLMAGQSSIDQISSDLSKSTAILIERNIFSPPLLFLDSIDKVDPDNLPGLIEDIWNTVTDE